MEDYGREPWGAEDTFHSRFAAELEVLAEREGGPAGPEACGDLLSGAPGAKRPRLELAPRRVLRRAPVLQDFVSVTSTDGHRAFLVLRADPAEGPSLLPDVRWRGGGRLDLLGLPLSSLKEQVDHERRQRDALHSPGPAEEGAEARPGAAPEERPAEQDAQHDLWVDEFAPRCYRELLSDDFTNRCLLKWLRRWDQVVFGHERPARKPRAGVEPGRGGKDAAAPGKWKSHEQVLEELLEAELDASRRPRHKVALLCGPPGLGKTTLAHVIARHAGYCVVEVNASDDRSPEALRARIEAATQMESVLGASGQPNCLVIDEIDGASTAAVNVLLGILNHKGPQAASAEGRQRGAERGLLLRPVICICNDLFAPALRQLKQQALVLHLPPTLPSRLVQRLQEICLRQGMRADPGALAALCEKTDNDIRACINTLQFLHGRGRRELSVRAVQATHVGLKDQRKGLFAVWQEVFQLPRPNRRQASQDPSLPALGLLPGDGDSGSLASQRFYHVLHVASSAGEHEKVVQGLFDNFLRLRLRDSSLGTVCAALDWLAFDDLLGCAAHHSQSFQLLRYPPFLPVAFHLLLACSHVPRIVFPSSQQEAQVRTTQMKNLMQALVCGIAPAPRSRAAPQALLLDALCLLLDILTPRLRPVSTQLYSAREKQQLASLVGTMLAYSLTYRQQRMPDGQYVYRLEPNVEELCRFPELPARKPLTYQAKQLIAREVELEKLRRAEVARVGKGNQVNGGPPAPGESRVQSPAPRALHNHEQRLAHLGRAVPEEQPERDFFGRVVVRRVAAPRADDHAACDKDSAEWRMGTAVGRSQVWFRFNEGVSNAVRRSLHIRDLL
ncbi:chromosome transmission fidelity protein 18 homolog [Ochotona curzoniae]|uniref:chromosome transmission fidelity protein 18 homolog n=1 Tax=Ochotona curzoniae TaxID=130825 RepID=UPI001B34F3A6|nr:chromosome transmission fidelity protein 18 homolog [Ochotona curzoniae]